ncbi:Cyclin-dependent kinase inhibitor 1B [Amphibalanus amphitrite]|uniref:Cyclin-dependent kinase inhibitor 1B n=1 Tax=Amphibalanus amphitrite TaxID=1232801 RepID=A0A6A4W6T5_AMPAM|nr:Cyclin-dependent kinase inhibitor 1B [Amphibalanus amphitrite]
MSCLPEQPSVADRPEALWRTAPALLQQARRFQLEACGGRRAKRALFGQPDREETRRFVKEELAAIRAADQQKYNFDFSQMRPLAGPFEWQPVTAGEVSAAYQLGRLQSGIHQHRSARRLDFDAPQPTSPADSRAGPAGSGPAAETGPAAPTRAESPGQPRPPTTTSSGSSSLTEALARRASPPPQPAAAAPRQSSISGRKEADIARRSPVVGAGRFKDFFINRKRTSAGLSCGDDSAAKRRSSVSPATNGGGGGGTSQQATAPATTEPTI